MILVTGGTGFIGSHLVDRLLAQGQSVRCLVRRTGQFERIPVEVVRGDLVTSDNLTHALRDVDTVIHLAGVTKAFRTADYYAGNLQATENLARAITRQRHPIRLVHVSSLAAIGPGQDATPVAEDAEPHPIAHYGKSKLEGERVLRAIMPQAVIVRPAVVYGPRDTDVFQILKSVSQGVVPRIAGGERWVSAIYVNDLVEGIIAASCAPNATGRAFFLAHPEPVSWSGFVAIAAKIMGRKPRVLTVPAPVAYAVGYGAELWARLIRKPGIVSRDKIAETRCPYWICDTSRAKNEIGFKATTPISDGLAMTLAWYREAGWLKWS